MDEMTIKFRNTETDEEIEIDADDFEAFDQIMSEGDKYQLIFD